MLAAISSDVWLPIATLVLGYGLTQLGDFLREGRQIRRDREARRDQFQRETLMELQEVLHDLGRTYGQEHHQDAMTAKKAGTWSPHLLGGDISDRNQEAESRSNILVARVGDEQVRVAVQEMKNAGANLTFANSQHESDAELGNSLAAFERANDRIGVLLREI